jgi:hypothetical protein
MEIPTPTRERQMLGGTLVDPRPGTLSLCLESGEGGIRTLEAGITRPRDFQSRSLSRSDTSPGG